MMNIYRKIHKLFKIDEIHCHQYTAMIEALQLHVFIVNSKCRY